MQHPVPIPVCPFYMHQKVVALNALKGSRIINGNIYTVASATYTQNPTNRKWFWYLYIKEIDNGTSAVRPDIFIPHLVGTSYTKKYSGLGRKLKKKRNA